MRLVWKEVKAETFMYGSSVAHEQSWSELGLGKCASSNANAGLSSGEALQAKNSPAAIPPLVRRQRRQPRAARVQMQMPAVHRSALSSRSLGKMERYALYPCTDRDAEVS